MSDTRIFCKITRGNTLAKPHSENGDFAVFHDVSPVAPMILPTIQRRHRVSLQNATADYACWLGKMAVLACPPATEIGCRPGPQDGFRLLVNSGMDAGQTVPHLHFHIIGGPRP